MLVGVKHFQWEKSETPRKTMYNFRSQKRFHFKEAPSLDSLFWEVCSTSVIQLSFFGNSKCVVRVPDMLPVFLDPNGIN